jgi:hypothetical protein
MFDRKISVADASTLFAVDEAAIRVLLESSARFPIIVMERSTAEQNSGEIYKVAT